MNYIIANMVCQRCVLVVQDVVKRLHLPEAKVTLGNVSFNRDLNSEQFQKFNSVLLEVGFEIVADKVQQLMIQVKQLIRAYLTVSSEGNTMNMSTYLTQHIYHDYSYLSDLFSRMEGKTMEQYFIELRLDKVKELLVYSDQSMSAIAYQLGYSSPQHMASQFKKYVGSTPSQFRRLH